ncbi:uncharacterized protein LOC135961064 [Calliphora vicina]|uniref:uncharacterized protein LOC135961064 n=1 Tax=Calliphora vicina TaxID=7373 RepID=UPI00325A5B22
MSNIQETSCEDDLKELLVSWKLENILCHLIAENITVEILEIMKASHIKPLLYKFSLGTQIRFEHNLEQWRSKIGKPLKYRSYNDRNQIRKSLPKKDLSMIIKTEPSINFHDSNEITNKEQNCISLINLKEILAKCTPDGPELLQIYKTNHTFSKPERSHLINIIVNYYLKHNLAFNLQVSHELETAILSMFPNEKLEMYRNTKHGKLYNKYLLAKAVYNKEVNESSEDYSGDEVRISKNVEQNNRATGNRLNMENEQSESLLIAPDYYGEDTAVTDMPTEILLQVLHNGCNKFIKIFEPYLYADFFLAACSLFNIVQKRDFYVAVNDCEILPDDFKNVILQYYKLPTFSIELKEKAIPVQLSKTEDFENSRSGSSTFAQSSAYTPLKSFGNNSTNNNSSVQVIYNYLPDANDIRNIPALLPIIKMSDDGKMLENRHRATIAKAIVDECLNFQPERILKRQDFFTLTQNLVCAFPKEVESTYFIPAQPNYHARGKLWNAYNNKRRILASSGVLERRNTLSNKRKHQSDGESDKTNDKVYVTDYSLEAIDFSLNSILDWDTIQQKWSESHRGRREELLKEKLLPEDYLNKYSILKSNRGIELMEIDVKILHPSVVNINNWLSLYTRIVDRGRTLRKVEAMPKILENIDSSSDEKYRASLALLIIPYIFPYNARRNEISNEKATKFAIQKRFIKEYSSLSELKSDTECTDLQLRFVHCNQQINYAEYKICGHVIKCVDLLEALNSIFHYIVALNIEYPRMCLHLWQFIQLAIFQIEIQDCMQANVESTYNDLCRS